MLYLSKLVLLSGNNNATHNQWHEGETPDNAVFHYGRSWGLWFYMDYSEYVLSATSSHYPELGECEKCPYVNKCDCGEKCIVHKSEIKVRDRKDYYKQNRAKILEQVKTIKQLKRL